MGHYRKLNYNNTVYLYNVGKTYTTIRGVGLFKNSEYGAKYSPSEKEETYVITPIIIKRMIDGKNNSSPIFYCKRHEHHSSELIDNIYYRAARDVTILTPVCPKCNHEQYMNS